MPKFKNGETVVILGESIGGFDFKGEYGVIIDSYIYGHYKVKVGDKTITYTENKLDVYKEDSRTEHLSTVNGFIEELELSNREKLIDYYLDNRDFDNLKKIT